MTSIVTSMALVDEADEPTENGVLGIYVDDHWAVSGAIVDRAEHLLRSNPIPPWTTPLRRLHDQLVDDDRMVSAVRSIVGQGERRWQRRACIVVDRVARLRSNGRMVRYSPLHRTLELESMIGHVDRVASFWRALVQIDDPRLRDFDLAGLMVRADTQLLALRELHARSVDSSLGRRDADPATADLATVID